MNDNKGQTIFLSVIGIATLLVAIIGATFAYFTTTIQGDNAGNVSATTAKLGKVTQSGDGITATGTILPGWYDDGTLTLTMEPGDVDVNFECKIQNITLTTDNETATLKDFYVTSEATATEGSGNTLSGTLAAETSLGTTKENADGIVIATGTLKGGNTTNNVQTISYRVGLTNKTDAAQNELQGAALAATVMCSTTSGANTTYSQSGPTR